MNNKKVITRIFGGLGNQLFCYAAARRLTLLNESELVIDDVSGFAFDFQYARKYALDSFSFSARKATPFERLEPFSRLRRYFKRTYNNLFPFDSRCYIQQVGNDFDSRLLKLRPSGNLYLEGYWQSEAYFKDVEQTIRNDLIIMPPNDVFSQAMAAKIKNCNAVSLHVRWHDLSNVNATNNLPADYYNRGISLMDQLIDAPHYFIFSDDPAAASSTLALPASRTTYVSQERGDAASNNQGFDERAITDLWLMGKCKHFITANSTFSWWGAWLKEGNEKIIVTPKLKINGNKMAWGFKGLIPDDWIQV